MDKKLKIKRTDDTPEINLDSINSIFLFEGISIPENTEKFYSPIISWIKQYSENPNKKNNVTFKLLYYNSTSTLIFTQILKLFELIHKQGNDVEVEWFYNPNDETVKEDGEEFANYFSMPFKLCEITPPK